MLLIVLTILLGTGVFISGLTYAFYWYEAACNPHPSHSTTCQGPRGLFWCVMVGFLSSVSSQLMVYVTYPIGFAKRLWKPSPSPSCVRPPVLLVHGLYHNASAWYLYKWWLRRSGYEKVFCLSYNTLKYDFWQLTEQLKDVVREAADLCGKEPIILMGHSLGGLLARAAIADPQTAELVRATILLGTPNQGSKLAALAAGKLGRSIHHNGALVQRINSLSSPKTMPKLNLFSPLDNMVLPTSSLEVPEEGWIQAQTAPISHISMLYHLPTVRLVMEFLDEFVPGCEAGSSLSGKPLQGQSAGA
ncbi:MAG: alpha/beta fold hydrolase [Desulfovibrio sp.]|nr:alpha/beta fold hydrolase [Desulfovibrio sp.]MBI4960313.1 alpha/beta fold hydrolase [Desulfovibrio sp.]